VVSGMIIKRERLSGDWTEGEENSEGFRQEEK